MNYTEEENTTNIPEVHLLQQIGPSIMYSNWCVICKKKKGATRIYKGNSLCEEHFLKEKNI